MTQIDQIVDLRRDLAELARQERSTPHLLAWERIKNGRAACNNASRYAREGRRDAAARELTLARDAIDTASSLLHEERAARAKR